MKWIKIILLGIGILIILFISLLFVLKDACQTTVYKTKVSPDGGKYKVVHQIIGCGATTNHATSVLVGKKWRPTLATNVFDLEGKYTEEEIKLMWESTDTLRIDFTGRATDIRRIAFKAQGLDIIIYENGNELSIERLEEIEKEIVKEQAKYKVVLPEGHRWIKIIQ